MEFGGSDVPYEYDSGPRAELLNLPHEPTAFNMTGQRYDGYRPEEADDVIPLTPSRFDAFGRPYDGSSPIPQSYEHCGRVDLPDVSTASEITNPLRARSLSGREGWMRNDISVTVLGDALDHPNMPRVSLFGNIGSANFRDSFCVVVADEGRLEWLIEHSVDTAEFDVESMKQTMGLCARWALGRLVEDPDSWLYNGLFRAFVWASISPAASTEFRVNTHTSETFQVATFDCANVVTGDRVTTRLNETRHEDRAQLSLALIPGDWRLVRNLARALANPYDAMAHDDLETAVTAAAAAMPEDTMLAPAGASDSQPVGKIDLSGETLTAAGVTAAIVGTDSEAHRTAAVDIEEIAVTGTWPANRNPLVRGSSGSAVEWHHLYWYLLTPNGKRSA